MILSSMKLKQTINSLLAGILMAQATVFGGYPHIIEAEMVNGVRTGRAILTDTGYAELEKRGVPRSTARQYSQRFIQDGFQNEMIAVSNLVLLNNSKVPPEIANKYPENYKAAQIADFYLHHIPPSALRVFPGQPLPLSVLESEDSEKPKVQFDQRFSLERLALEEVQAIVTCRIDPATANNYDQRFDAKDIRFLYQNSILPPVANPYQPEIPTGKIPECVKIGLEPSYAEPFFQLNKKGFKINADDVILFYQEGITFPEVKATVKQTLINRALSRQ